MDRCPIWWKSAGRSATLPWPPSPLDTEKRGLPSRARSFRVHSSDLPLWLWISPHLPLIQREMVHMGTKCRTRTAVRGKARDRDQGQAAADTLLESDPYGTILPSSSRLKGVDLF